MSLQVSSSPHIRDNSTSQRLMLDVIIALIPTLAASLYFFGERVLFIVIVTVLSAVLFEYLSRLVLKRYNSISDLSAIVTGLLLALNLPPTVPFWLPIIGAFVAIVIVKQMFGGIGNNFVNPAMASRVILMLSFPVAMTKWVVSSTGSIPFGGAAGGNVDLIATATPLLQLQTGAVEGSFDTYLQLFIGNKGGCIGEVSILALLIGAAYLLIRKVISFHIPVVYIGTVAIMMLLLGQDPLVHLLAGGLVLGAVFMATDYVTSPLTNKGKIIFGIGCGVITSLIRVYGGMTEGVSFSILLMNILTPHIDRWTMPVPLEEVPSVQKDKGYMPAIILCVICLVTTALLAVTNQITYLPRLELEAAALKADQQTLFPNASEFTPIDIAAHQAKYPGVTSALVAKSASGVDGVLIRTASRGYGGDVPVLLAFDKSGQILRMKFLSNDETPGLGKKVENQAFFGQFIGKSTDKLFTVKATETDKVRIDAVAGATISSRAVTEAINSAASIFKLIASEVK